MDDFVTSRRGFLKGIMAAAAVSAVGVPAVFGKIPEVPPEPVVEVLPPVEPGDFWMKLEHGWQFIGRLKAVSVLQDSVPFGHHEGYVERLIVDPPRLEVEVVADPVGHDTLFDILALGRRADILFVHGNWGCIQRQAFMHSAQYELENGFLPIVHIGFILSETYAFVTI